jgi:F0F1-type ATP synthase membrane subunit b/b'
MLKRYGLEKLLVLMVALSLALLNGCAKPPTKEVENAEKAVAEAKQKEADLYSEDVFIKAEDALKRAKDSIAVKKYKEAKIAAEETGKLAQQAISMVEPNKAKMRAEAEQFLKDIQGAINELKTSVAKAVKKKFPINREEIQGMIGKWEVDMVSIKDQLQAQKIRQAYDQLKSMQKQIKSQKERLTATLETKAEDKKQL